MDRSELRALLEDVARGDVAVEDAVGRVGASPIKDLGFARPDHHRGLMTGTSEVVYGAGKTVEQIVRINGALLAGGQKHVLTTRVDAAKAGAVLDLVSKDELCASYPATYYEDARAIVVGEMPEPNGNGLVVVACAGTSDLYCAEEAAITVQSMGSRVERLYDVGVAGIHRLLSHVDLLQQATAVVAVAGMEGALASVIGGLCACPVIACPTSVGYGASFGGLSALLAMLNSCSCGTSVVNIDNGFGAGFQAALIDHARTK